MQSGAQILKEQCVEESSGKVFKNHIPGPHPQRLLIIQKGRSDAQKSVLAVASPPHPPTSLHPLSLTGRRQRTVWLMKLKKVLLAPECL